MKSRTSAKNPERQHIRPIPAQCMACSTRSSNSKIRLPLVAGTVELLNDHGTATVFWAHRQASIEMDITIGYKSQKQTSDASINIMRWSVEVWDRESIHSVPTRRPYLAPSRHIGVHLS